MAENNNTREEEKLDDDLDREVDEELQEETQADQEEQQEREEEEEKEEKKAQEEEREEDERRKKKTKEEKQAEKERERLERERRRKEFRENLAAYIRENGGLFRTLGKLVKAFVLGTVEFAGEVVRSFLFNSHERASLLGSINNALANAGRDERLRNQDRDAKQQRRNERTSQDNREEKSQDEKIDDKEKVAESNEERNSDEATRKEAKEKAPDFQNIDEYRDGIAGADTKEFAKDIINNANKCEVFKYNKMATEIGKDDKEGYIVFREASNDEGLGSFLNNGKPLGVLKDSDITSLDANKMAAVCLAKKGENDINSRLKAAIEGAVLTSQMAIASGIKVSPTEVSFADIGGKYNVSVLTVFDGEKNPEYEIKVNGKSIGQFPAEKSATEIVEDCNKAVADAIHERRMDRARITLSSGERVNLTFAGQDGQMPNNVDYLLGVNKNGEKDKWRNFRIKSGEKTPSAKDIADELRKEGIPKADLIAVYLAAKNNFIDCNTYECKNGGELQAKDGKLTYYAIQDKSEMTYQDGSSAPGLIEKYQKDIDDGKDVISFVDDNYRVEIKVEERDEDGNATSIKVGTCEVERVGEEVTPNNIEAIGGEDIKIDFDNIVHEQNELSDIFDLSDNNEAYFGENGMGESEIEDNEISADMEHDSVEREEEDGIELN